MKKFYYSLVDFIQWIKLFFEIKNGFDPEIKMDEVSNELRDIFYMNIHYQGYTNEVVFKLFSSIVSSIERYHRWNNEVRGDVYHFQLDVTSPENQIKLYREDEE